MFRIRSQSCTLAGLVVQALILVLCGRAMASPEAAIRAYEAAQESRVLLPAPDPLSRRAGGPGLINFGPAAPPWLTKLRDLRQRGTGVFRIVLLGDSHTACSYFGDALRDRLQGRLGNAGFGWMQPNAVRGQYVALMSYRGERWSTKSSREGGGDFPLGGLVAQGSGALTLTPKNGDRRPMSLKLIARCDCGTGRLVLRDGEGRQLLLPVSGAVAQRGWQVLEAHWVALPLSFIDPEACWRIGPIGLELEASPSGLTLSALGINGAELHENRKWRSGWPRDLAATAADLVILEYGTNEAFGRKNVDIAQLAWHWRQSIRKIRWALPEAGILIVGAPEALQDATAGPCGERPLHLDRVQAMQKSVARSNQALYWSWQEAMGGSCSMRRWMSQGLALQDGVHFNQAGYRQFGAALAEAILELAE